MSFMLQSHAMPKTSINMKKQPQPMLGGVYWQTLTKYIIYIDTNIGIKNPTRLI
jgi:hypothetical protein